MQRVVSKVALEKILKTYEAAEDYFEKTNIILGIISIYTALLRIDFGLLRKGELRLLPYNFNLRNVTVTKFAYSGGTNE